MSSSELSPTNQPNGVAKDHRHDQASEQKPCSRDQLSDLAALVASGDVPVPTDLTAEQLQHLVQRVRELRRSRLVNFIARAIAKDIERTGKPS